MCHSFNAVQTFCDTKGLLPAGCHVLVGFSGGPDSTFLLHFLAERQRTGALTVSAAHLDHGWRPESAQDAQHCRAQAHALGVAYHEAHARDVQPAKKYNGSREDFARMLRRTFFEQTATAIGADRIAVAHQRQDQQETFFIRLLRGATLTGLTGMRAHSGPYIRPLLETDRATIMAYLHAHNIAYLHDSTNDSEQFLRNRIRARVIPALHGADSRFETTFAHTISQLHETEDFLNTLTQQFLSKLVEYDGEHPVLNCAPLKDMHPVMQKRILLAWLCATRVPFSPSNALLAEIIRFMRMPGSKEHQLAATWSLVKSKEYLWIKPVYNARRW